MSDPKSSITTSLAIEKRMPRLCRRCQICGIALTLDSALASRCRFITSHFSSGHEWTAYGRIHLFPILTGNDGPAGGNGTENIATRWVHMLYDPGESVVQSFAGEQRYPCLQREASNWHTISTV
ncbi:hypothetical protein XA68_13447 [Ophiocordyceps unilateralis]|uniref:Uncharacterized protein n=1 Tax=Ophiocordyceps unilateralis TaxID=268505 RepID=A0A2A9PCP3_OPHUN|nr:hypothetical protein XA68_13447 [Ophiocordyceps unilateralis]